jgi:lipid A 3-O-deacylase
MTALLVVLLCASPALAFDPAQTFHKGATVLSVEGGGGHQDDLEGHRHQTGLDIVYGGVRYALIPFDPVGPSLLHGALEIGLEPMYVRYVDPVSAFWAGLSAHARWYFLSLGRFAPYVEAGAGAGGTDLEVKEIDSAFAFLLNVGAGASVFVTDALALYAGYRLIHVSNGNTSQPNRGFEVHTALIGVSYYFK